MSILTKLTGKIFGFCSDQTFQLVLSGLSSFECALFEYFRNYEDSPFCWIADRRKQEYLKKFFETNVSGGRNFWSGGVNPLNARRRPRQVGSRAGQRLRFQLGPGLGESAAESPLVSSASYPFHALRASLHGRRAVVRTEPRRSPVVSRLKTPFGAKARQKKRQANATRFFG